MNQTKQTTYLIKQARLALLLGTLAILTACGDGGSAPDTNNSSTNPAGPNPADTCDQAFSARDVYIVDLSQNSTSSRRTDPPVARPRASTTRASPVKPTNTSRLTIMDMG